MKGSDFVFDSVELIYYKCHKEIFKHDGSYIDSPDLLIKKKKVRINTKKIVENFFSICSKRCVKL